MKKLIGGTQMAKDSKSKKDIGKKLATKIMAIILAVMMILSIAATLIFCILGR